MSDVQPLLIVLHNLPPESVYPQFTNQKEEVHRKNMNSDSAEGYNENSKLTGRSEKPAELSVGLL